MRSPYVFVSYSSKDERWAKQLALEFEQAGIKHFLDRQEIDVGDNFKAKITEGIDRCTDLVLVVSEESLKSLWVVFELGQAIALRCRVLAFITKPGISLPPFVSDFQYATTVSEIVAYFKRRIIDMGKSRGILISRSSDSHKDNEILLSPSLDMTKFMARFPTEWFHGHIAIDGAVELHSFPQGRSRYGGITRDQCKTIIKEVEWSDQAIAELPIEKRAILGNELREWIGTRRAKPNRIRFLVEPPAQTVLDNTELQMTIGNSDYFIMRTVTSLSMRSHNSPDDNLIRSVFDSFWGEAKTPFSANVVPYHISAQGILLVTDPTTKIKHLILTLPSRQRKPLVPGWNVSFAEQMWAPSRHTKRKEWWDDFVSGLTINQPNERTGDVDIWSTAFRGLDEELGIKESDLVEKPRLVSSCIEQDMYFVAFVFVIQASLTLEELQKRRLGSSDKEIGAIAAYPVDGVLSDGTELDQFEQFAKLLSKDRFDGGPYLIPRAEDSLIDGWHLSSRLRILTAAWNLEGNRILDHVNPYVC